MSVETIRVLLVEDDPDDYELIRKYVSQIKNSHYDFTWASSYSTGLEKLAASQFHLILLDFRLGPHTGLEFLQEADRRQSTAPVVFLTGLDDFDTDLKTMRAGAADFISKNRLDSFLLERTIRYALERSRAAKDLKRSEENFRSLIELLPEGLMVHRDNKILYVNPNLVRLLGYTSPEHLIGRSPLDIVHPDYRSVAEKRIDMVAQGEGNQYNPPAERILLRKNGDPIYAEAEGLSIIFEGQRAITTIIRDITEKKRAEEELRESHFFLEKAQEAAHLGSWISGIGANADLIWSQECYRIFGVDSGLPLKVRDFFERIHPEDLETVQKAAEKALYHNSPYHLDHRIRMPNGGIRWVNEQAEVIRDKSGQPLKMVGVVQDITERKIAEQALRHSENQFRAVFDGALEAMLIIDDQGQIMDANKSACSLLECGKGEILQRQIEGFFESNFDFQWARKSYTTTGLFSGKIRLRKNSDETLDAEFTARGHILPGRHLAVFRDVTERSRLERQAFLNDKLATVGTLAAGIAHEINNPMSYVLANLGFLKGNLEMLQSISASLRSIATEPVREKKLEKLEKFVSSPHIPRILFEVEEEITQSIEGSQRIRDIVLGLKSFARFDDDEMHPVRLNELMDAAISMMSHEIKYRARLEKKYDEKIPAMSLNTGKLQQVFVNLLVNAAQSIEPGKVEQNKITVTTQKEGDAVWIRISDTGSGIPKEVLPKIFNPFFTTKPVGSGTGLGLSICFEIVRSHGGEIQVESEIGKGTTFSVHLPIREGGPALENKAQELKATRRADLLIVDDEPINLKVFKRMVEKNHQALTALGGREALQCLEKADPKLDIIITDLNMPDVSGMQLYEYVREKLPHLAPKMIFITGGAFTDASKDFLKKVDNPRLEKPFEAQELLKAIHDILEKPER
jgi:PAS domain S-box-containing protein